MYCRWTNDPTRKGHPRRAEGPPARGPAATTHGPAGKDRAPAARVLPAPGTAPRIGTTAAPRATGPGGPAVTATRSEVTP